ncbi:hypothetical protein A4G19_14135 [Pasteurellaceae bacterium Macca]|nr:hypothetical protein [Pasteurellaceae bacterium Macca]MCK3655976.1 hypothetical protein [Pasteurellaceae bacterium Macca]MCK3655990.1 hypothetical protein [Pasteurellaceae bacterium Macca]MCK3656026.1 hypothetical protein [Pasteurellaceae bacterium Macca]MCK3656041.1 hypothetical protein [Pasteurellaceae bacterium Macca]
MRHLSRNYADTIDTLASLIGDHLAEIDEARMAIKIQTDKENLIPDETVLANAILHIGEQAKAIKEQAEIWLAFHQAVMDRFTQTKQAKAVIFTQETEITEADND